MVDSLFLEKTPPVTVVISTRNRGDEIVATLRTVLENDYPNFEVRIVDQSTNDLTEKAVQPFLSDSRVVYQRSATKGLSIGRNLAVSATKNELIAFTDDDCEVPSNWLREMVASFKLDERIGMVFGNVEAGEHDTTAGWIPISERLAPVMAHNIKEKTKLTGIGACMGMRRSVWGKTHGFDPVLGAGAKFKATEENDLAIKTLLAGYYVYETPQVRVIHNGFRPWSDASALLSGYSYGIGGAYAKHLKAGHWSIVPIIAEWGQKSTGYVLQNLVKRRVTGLKPLLAYGKGLIHGLTTPLDRQTGNFTTETRPKGAKMKNQSTVYPDKGTAKRVAFVHDTNLFGGMEVHMLLLMRYFDRARYTPMAVVPGYTDEFRGSPQRFIDEVEQLGFPVLQPPHPGETPGVSFVKDVLNLSKLFKDNAIDIIHVHSCRPDGARKATMAARLAGVPVVLRSEHLPPSINATPYSKYTTKPLDALTDCIVATSNACLKEQIEFLGRNPKKMYRSYYGIETERFNPNHDVAAAKRRLGFDPNIPLIGKIGRLVEQKGHPYLIEAAAQVIKEYGPVNFVLIGDGPLEDELKAQVAKLGISDYVHFAGFISNPIPYIEAMDIATMSSLFEALGIAVLEYMVMGKPSVVTNLDCFQEMLTDGETGVVVDVKSGSALAQGYLKLLRDPALARRMGQTAIHRVRSEFTVQHNTNDIMNLYDRLLGQHSITPVASATTSKTPMEV